MRACLLVILITTVFLTPAPADCDVVNKVCDDMAAMIYDMCVVGGQHTLSQCAEHEAVFRIQCKKDNGCLPSGN